MTPHEKPSDSPENAHTGRRCPHCGGKNTCRDTLSHSSSNFLLSMVTDFTWLWTRRIDYCRDCGETNAYIPTSSKVVLIVGLILLALSIIGKMQGTP